MNGARGLLCTPVILPESIFNRTVCALALLCLLGLSLAGCTKKSLTKSQARAVTAELVSAAQQATSRKSGIAIRPEISSDGSAPRRLLADDIYVTLPDPAKAAGLRHSIQEIARRHNLEEQESTSNGVERFDLTFAGTRTHTVHVITPVTASPHPIAPNQNAPGPRLAIILDDLGYERAAANAALSLPFPLTVSVLPNLPLSAEVAEEAYRRGDEVLLHMPMESASSDAKGEPIQLRPGMSARQTSDALAEMLSTVPHAVGVNNHQGSLATADPRLMSALMPALHDRHLFFIDSRTTTATVAYDAAEGAGVRAASRKVFLDDNATKDAILSQLLLAGRDAARDGSAIAIGHPHPTTIAALTEGVPRVQTQGVRLVFASELVR